MSETTVEKTETGSLMIQRMNLLPQNMEQVFRFGEMMSNSGCVPTHLANKDACTSVVLQSLLWGLNPFAVAQKTYMITKGKLNYEAQLVMAVINVSGALKTSIAFSWDGDWTKVQGKVEQKTSSKAKDEHDNFKKYFVPGWKPEDEKGLSCTVTATLKKDGLEHSLTVSLTQATIRNSTLWASDPRQQLAYLTVKRWANLYCPEVILGFTTDDDNYDQAQAIDGGEIPVEPVKSAMLPIGEEEDDTQPEPIKQPAPEPEATDPEPMPTDEEKHALWVAAKALDITGKDLVSAVKEALGYPPAADFTMDKMSQAECREATTFFIEQIKG